MSLILYLLAKISFTLVNESESSDDKVSSYASSALPTPTVQSDDSAKAPVFNKEKNVVERNLPDNDVNSKEKFIGTLKEQLLSAPMIVTYVLLSTCCATGFVYVYLLKRSKQKQGDNDGRRLSNQLMVQLDPSLSEETPFDI